MDERAEARRAARRRKIEGAQDVAAVDVAMDLGGGGGGGEAGSVQMPGNKRDRPEKPRCTNGEPGCKRQKQFGSGRCQGCERAASGAGGANMVEGGFDALEEDGRWEGGAAELGSTWVQCERCYKWRRAFCPRAELPSVWYAEQGPSPP